MPKRVLSVFCMRNLYCMFLFLMRFINEFLRKIKGVISNFDLFSLLLLFFFSSNCNVLFTKCSAVYIYIYIYIYRFFKKGLMDQKSENLYIWKVHVYTSRHFSCFHPILRFIFV